MASIAGAGPLARARWTLTALLRLLHPSERPRQDAVTVTVARTDLRPRRHYPPQRDSFIERSTMAREMYRL